LRSKYSYNNLPLGVELPYVKSENVAKVTKYLSSTTLYIVHFILMAFANADKSFHSKGQFTKLTQASSHFYNN